MKTVQILITVPMGKRLIARGLTADPAVKEVMARGRLLIVAGTTNAYVAQEALQAAGGTAELDPRSFRRGVTLAPGAKLSGDQTKFDLLIDRGEIRMDRTVFEIAPELGPGDMILKGANALWLPGAEAGTLIGHPQGGTIIPILTAAIGRRVQIVVPIGLEKRVEKPVSELARMVNAAGAEGPRLCPLPGRVYTELDAVRTLTGARAELLAAGGALGAEGAVYLAVTGEESQLEILRALMEELRREPASLL